MTGPVPSGQPRRNRWTTFYRKPHPRLRVMTTRTKPEVLRLCETSKRHSSRRKIAAGDYALINPSNTRSNMAPRCQRSLRPVKSDRSLLSDR